MEHANARDETPAEGSGKPRAERLAVDTAGIAEETEFLPYTPGGDLPEEVEEALGQAATEDAASLEARVAIDEAATGSRSDADTASAGDVDSVSGSAVDPLEEIRSIFLGQAAGGQLDIAQVASSLSDQIERTRREFGEELNAAVVRIREEIWSSASDLASEVEHRALLSRGADETAKTVDELLNLVSLTYGGLRAELEQHSRETKAALDDVLSLVRELACTLAIMIGGEEERPADLEETIVPEIAHRGHEPKVDAPLLTELPVAEEIKSRPSPSSQTTRRDADAVIEPPSTPGDAAKFYF